MKHIIYWIGCSIIAFTIASCSSDEDVVKEDPLIPEVANPTPNEQPSNGEEVPSGNGEEYTTCGIGLTDSQKTAVNQNNSFAFRFFQNLISQNVLKGKSIVTSPLSATYALGMINSGAQGKTSEEITSMLGFAEGSKHDINKLCKTLIEEAPLVDKQVVLKLADCIVANQKVTLASDYQKSMEDFYKAEVFSKDLTNPAIVEFINDWCNQHTEGMIKKIVDKLDPNTQLMLMNAIYFKAAWSGKFDKQETKVKSFTSEDGKEIKVKMMNRCKGTLYCKNDVYATIGLPYGKGDKWFMYFLLPNEGKTIANIFTHIDKVGWESIRSKLEGKLVNVEIPRFKTESEMDLNNVCQALGANSLFNQNSADLTLMTQNKAQLWIDLIKQKAAIEVSEEGTETSAVTFDMATGFSGKEENGTPIDQFIANHPFVYIIQEASSGAIFFIGTFQGN